MSDDGASECAGCLMPPKHCCCAHACKLCGRESYSPVKKACFQCGVDRWRRARRSLQHHTVSGTFPVRLTCSGEGTIRCVVGCHGAVFNTRTEVRGYEKRFLRFLEKARFFHAHYNEDDYTDAERRAGEVPEYRSRVVPPGVAALL